MSDETNDEPAKKQSAKTRKRFKITVVCLGLIVAAAACAIEIHLGDSFLRAIQAANITYLAIFLTGFFIDLIVFGAK